MSSGDARAMCKAISLWQPWASLIAYGVKTIETRSWSTSYRGPIAIHAAKTTKGIDELPGDCEGKTEGGWVYGYVGDFQASYCRQTSDEGRRGEAEMIAVEDGNPLFGLEAVPLPLGAVVATATLVDCVPMGNCHDPYAPEIPKVALAIKWGGDQAWHVVGGTTADVSDQLPYGDFRPGRWAWLLADIERVDPPIPARGAQGLWTWTPAHFDDTVHDS